MRNHTRRMLQKRQAQWEAFNHWESDSSTKAISIEERIAWYIDAYSFSRSTVSGPSPDDVQRRVVLIQEIRKRLERLSPTDRNV